MKSSSALSRRRADFLAQVLACPGQSIYALAGHLNMSYRRAHEHAHGLADANLVQLTPSVHRGRRQLLVAPRVSTKDA